MCGGATELVKNRIGVDTIISEDLFPFPSFNWPQFHIGAHGFFNFANTICIIIWKRQNQDTALYLDSIQPWPVNQWKIN